MRRWTFALVAVAAIFGAGRLSADEIKGKVKAVDPEKGTITLAVGDAERTLAVASDARVFGLFGKKLKKATTRDVAGGLRGVKEGVDVILSTEAKDDGKPVVTRVSVETLQPKVKKKKNG
jgi:hypothetical protein